MKTNQGTITLAERAADNGRLRSVLHDWGYKDSEIKRLFSESESLGSRVLEPTSGKPSAAKPGDDVRAASHQAPDKL